MVGGGSVGGMGILKSAKWRSGWGDHGATFFVSIAAIFLLGGTILGFVFIVRMRVH